MKMPEYLSLSQAAAAWGVSRQAVWLAVRLGRFPFGTVTRIGRQWGVTSKGMQAVFGPPRRAEEEGD